MSCHICQIPVGEVTNLNLGPGHFACCIKCNGDVASFWPRQGIHNGKNEQNYHVFKLLVPFSCPHCGMYSDMSTMECEDGGGVMKLASLLIELPERVEK